MIEKLTYKAKYNEYQWQKDDVYGEVQAESCQLCRTDSTRKRKRSDDNMNPDQTDANWQRDSEIIVLYFLNVVHLVSQVSSIDAYFPTIAMGQ